MNKTLGWTSSTCHLSEPDRIVGELLQPGGYLKLIELRLEGCVDKIDAQQVFGYALFKDGETHKTLLSVGKVSLRCCRQKLSHWTFYSEDEREGCLLSQVDVPSCFVGLVLENCELPCANHGHVILGEPSPVLFYPISSTEIRCLVDVPGQKVPSISNGEMAKYLKTVIAPQVPHELHGAFITAVDKGSIRTMPNRSMPATPHPTLGALLMGDAFNMHHPLTRGGLTVVLSDIVVLRNLLRPLRDLNDAPNLCKYLESFYTLRKVMCTITSIH